MKIDWPENDGLYKVVQVEIDSLKYIKISKKEIVYHGDILADLLKEVGIPFELDERYDRSVPLAEGERYKLFGAGKVRVNVAEKKAKFGGASVDYWIRFDEACLEELETNWDIECVGMLLK